MDKPKPRKHEPHKRDLLDRVLVGASEEAKAKILEILNAHDIEPDDPMFLALVAVTDCRMAVAPIPQELAALTQNLQAVLEELRERVKTSQDSQEIVLRKHQNLANDFCSTTEELNNLLNQQISYIESVSQMERHRTRKQGALGVPIKTIFLWSLVTSCIGGIAGALVIWTMAIVAAAQ